MLVLGSAHVPPEVDGLHVLDGDDALGDARRVAHASVHQPPGGLDVSGTLALWKYDIREGRVYYCFVVARAKTLFSW